MEKITLKDVLRVTHQGPERVTRDYCEEKAPHYPHVVTAIKDGDRYIPITKTVCPGLSGSKLWIYTARVANYPTWLIVDYVEERWRPWLEQRVSSEWVKIYYEELKVGRYYFEGTPDYCGSVEAHHPHVTDIYNTRRWGPLQVFCPGLPGANYEIYECPWERDFAAPCWTEYLIVEE
jgi:hypothetical protein